MKKLNNLIVPALIIAIVAIIYFAYFQKSGLGNFEDFDTNNNANKDIIVQVVKDKGSNVDQANGAIMFFAKDSKGVEVRVQAPLPLPAEFETIDRVSLKGHLHEGYFHATEVTAL